MNRTAWRVFAWIFAFFSVGGIGETLRIITSMDADIVEDGSGLTIMSIVMTSGLILLTIFFVRKSLRYKDKIGNLK